MHANNYIKTTTENTGGTCTSKITLKGCVEKWHQGVLTKRQYVTSWEWEHVGHAEYVLYKY